MHIRAVEMSISRQKEKEPKQRPDHHLLEVGHKKADTWEKGSNRQEAFERAQILFTICI